MKRGREWTETRYEKNKSTKRLEAVQVPMYAVILDIPQVRSALELKNISLEEQDEIVDLLELLVPVERAQWRTREVEELERAAGITSK